MIRTVKICHFPSYSVSLSYQVSDFLALRVTPRMEKPRVVLRAGGPHHPKASLQLQLDRAGLPAPPPIDALPGQLRGKLAAPKPPVSANVS